jgi:hypothetical protein
MSAPGTKNYSAISGDTNTFTNIIRAAVGQGAMLGFGDEVEAYIRSKIDQDKSYDEIVTEIRGDLNTFRKERPFLAYGSEIAGGAVTGAAGLGRSVLKTALKSAPIGALYGAGVSEGDLTTKEGLTERAKSGAISGAVTGVASPIMSKVAPMIGNKAKELMKKGVSLTPGQATSGTVFGSMLKRAEDAMSSFPLLSTQPALQAAKETFNRAVYKDVLKKINVFMPKSTSIEDMGSFATNKIKTNLDKVVLKLKLTNSDALKNKFSGILQNSGLDDVEINNWNKIFNKMIFDKSVRGVIKGKNLQNADVYLRRTLSNYKTSPDAKQREMGYVLQELYDVFDNQLANNNTGNLLKQYTGAKSAYADLMAIMKAGTSTTGDNLFSPKQLLAAIKSLDKSSGKRLTFEGKKPLQDIATKANQIISNVTPDSGTASRGTVSALALGAGTAVEPTTAGVTAAILAAYQNPATKRALLEATRAGGGLLRGSVFPAGATVPQGLLQK